MACSKQSAKDYIANARVYLVGELRNLSVILENLYQQKVLTDEEVSKIKAEKDDYDRTKAILDSVTRKGEAACYRFLRIIDQTRRTLERPTPIFKISHETSTEATKFDLHHWISCFSFTEDPETDQNYIQESRPCYRYQAKLKSKAEKISKDFWKRSENLFAEKKKPELLYTSLILDIQGKNFPTRINRFKRDMCRPKKLRTEISPSDLLKADKNILLVGKPGIGKTALSHEILRLWSERDSKELDYMFYFDMRELTNISPITSLEDLLFTACSEPDKGKDEVLHDIKSNSDNVTVILDGVTDFSTSVVKKLVDKDFLPDAKIIITCRPNDGKDLCPEDWLRVEVKGFSEETIKTYLSSTLGEAHRKVFRNVELLTLCHVPMYALMVAASFSSKDSLQPRTVTEIYINIVRFGLQMNSNKTRIRNLNQFIKTKRNGILSLAEAAFNATERKTVNLGELSCEDSCVLSFLKTLDVKVSPTETKTLYAFLHYTMQDFFAALWLLENPDNIREVFQQCLTEEKKHMKHLIPFMCRLLNDKSPRLMSCLIPAEEIKETSGWFFTEIIDTFFHQAVANISELHVDTLFVYQCLFESQSSEVCISFLAKLDFHLDLSGANLDPYSCCAVAYVVTQSKERKISLNLQDVTITAQGMRHLFGCLQNVEWYDTLKQQLWKIFLLSEEQMDYQTLLGLSGNLLHLPVVGKKKLFDRAVKVLQTIATKVNVCLYGDRKDPLCPILRNSLLETLPCINSLRMTYRSAGSMNQEECNNTMEKDQKNMFLDLCFTTALYSKQKFYSAMPELVRVCQVKTDLVNTLVDLHQHAISRGLSTDFPTLRPVFQSTPADWLIDLSERKASTLLEMLKLQSEKKKVELTGFSHDKSEMRNLLQCLPYLSKLSFVTEPTESSESIWFLEKLICAAAEMKEQNGVNMLELLSVCTYRGTPLQWKWCDFLLDLYSSKTETGPTFSSFTSVLQSADPAIWFVKLSKTKASMLLDVLKLQSGKKQVNLTGCSHEEAEVRSFLHCLPYISRLSVVPLWSSSVEQTRFLTRLFCAAAEREKQTGEKILEMLASVCRYEHFPFNNRSIDETYRRNFLLDLYSQMNDCETETGLSLLPSIQSVFQSAPEIWTLDLSKIKTSILLEVMKLQPEKKQVKVTNWSYEEHEVRNLIKCLPYISKFRFVPESSKLHEQTSFLVTLYCAAAEREQQTGEKMLDRLASVCTFKIIPVSDTDMNEQAQKVFLLSLYSQVTDYESKTGLSLFPLLKSVFQSVANVWITDLSERNTLMLRELLIQSEKKQVVLKGCSHEESEVKSFLECLPFFSQLSFEPWVSEASEEIQFLRSLFCAAEKDEQKEMKTLDMLASVYIYREAPLKQKWSEFLLELFSYELKTGLSVPPLQRANVILFKVLKLKSSRTHGPRIAPGSSDLQEQRRFLVNLFCAAAEREQQTGEKMVEMLAPLCRYKTFPFKAGDKYRVDFLLDLYSQVKDRETKSGLSLLPSLQSVFQSAPKLWTIKFSKRKTSDFMEVMKLQAEKKRVELTDCSYEESEVRSFLQCLPFISQLSLDNGEGHSCDPDEQTRLLVNLFCAAAEREQQTGEKILDMLASVCKFETFSFQNEKTNNDGDAIKDRLDFLLDLYSYMKDCETKTGLSLLPSLQSVFQSAPLFWTINLSKRTTSILLEVMKLQPEKKRVNLTDCSHGESEVRSFLKCLPFISQLSFDPQSSDPDEQTRFLVNLFCAAAEREQQTGEKMLEMLASVCRYKTFPLYYNNTSQSDFLLDLYSQLKDRETKSGLSLLPSLQSVFQSAPLFWTIKLSERKTSILLEVMKLQPEKKPVELTDCSHEESEVRSFLQCLPFISQLSFDPRSSDLHEQTRFLVNLFCAAAEREQQTGEKMLEMLASVCRYKTFPLDDRCMANFEYGYRKSQSDFLLDLYSQMKDRETKSGLSLLPSLQSVFQSFPFFWTIKLSERKTSILLEVMKLQPEKKPVMLTDCSHGESEVRSFLQCLPFISQLRCMPRFFQSVCSSLSVRSREEIQQLVSLLQLLNFNLFLTGELNDKTCSSVGKVLPLVGSKVDLILTDSRMSVRGAAVLFRSTTQLHSLRLSNSLVLFFSQWVRRGRVAFPLVLEELTVVSTKAQPQRVLLKVGSSLASLLRFWTVGRLDLTESGLPVQSLFSLLLHDGPLTLRLSEERLQQLLVLLHEVQDQDRTLSLLNKVGGDLSSCQLSWELLHFLLQQPTGQTITVNLKKNRFLEERAAELLPFLHRMVIQRLSPSFVRTSIREIFRTHPSHMISWLLRSLDLVINLNCTELDSKDCDALLFILRHSDGVKLKLLWSSIPAEGIQSILSMLHTVSDLSVDRNLLLRFIHCCAASDSQQGAASGLLRTLRHRLDLSCSSCVELPEEDQTEPLRLTAADCWAVSTVLRRSSRDTQLDLRDCEVEDSGLDLLFPVLDGVRLRVNKTVPVQLLSLLAANNQGDAVRRATSLCRALGGELDLSHRPLDQRLCGALALMLDYSEDLTELDLSHCQLTDQLLLQLITHLHKVHNLDLSHNQITDASTGWLLHLVAINPFIVSVSLNNNNIINKTPFKDNRKFEIS
uniref:Si:ch211-108d22.2 n=1 Tax=Xiphophorus maculatus TaxID=8083 RepID=A0A3B5QU12_XIPMA